LFAACRRLSTQLQFNDVLSNCDGIFLIDQKLLDGASLGSIQRDIDLVRLNGGDLLVLLDVVANLWRMLVRTFNSNMNSVRFDHCFSVPSVMDSAISGTLTVVTSAGICVSQYAW
jgi:hypothetical protein